MSGRYSARRASMGWIRRPRRAGPIVANNPTIVMTTAVTGNSARPKEPSISPSLARSIMSASTVPTTMPAASCSAALVKMLRNSWPGISAQRGPDADFLAALRYGERHHGVDAGRRQQQRAQDHERGAEHHQAGPDLPFRFISLNVTICNRSVGSNDDVSSRRRDENCNGSLPRIRISAVARVELRSE